MEPSQDAISSSYDLVVPNGRLPSRLCGGVEGVSKEVALVRRIAKKKHSAAFAQLASRICVSMKFRACAGEVP